ncbi:oligoendopeptidase F [Clostridium sp. P21]|uniref:Oligopeptidase F n=1 Tax=Clostridium muellerianum TaxID=2716538 RepID=A0A7Y0EG32_9CLOT|nr:oligoendopeptidase F [Clostridium muellerianum]NMM62839.1 oligoendopeptidase F [Clostridium muellerianum]
MSQIKKRDEILQEDKWKVEKIYKDIESFEADFKKLKGVAPKLCEYAGKLSDGEKLLEYFKLDEEVSRLAGKLAIFAHMKNDEDTANPTFQVLKDKIFEYNAEIQSMQAFFIPEILSLEEGTIDKFIKSVPELNMYKFLLEKILKKKPHTLSVEQEKLIASVSDCLNAPEKVYSMLSNADMTFPKIKDEKGKKVELTDVNYSSFIRSKKRTVRKEAFKALFGTYKKYENTLAASLTSNIKNFIFISKTRKYESSMECSLKPNDIPLDVYNNTVDTVNNNLKSLHRYVSIKKKLLKLDDMHMYDLYVPLIDTVQEHIEYNEAVKIVKEGLKPLGKEYLDIFDEGINDGWVDIYPNKGKRGGAYSTGDYDTMPYVLLNYDYKLNDVSTLAHEMGHSIHSYYSRKNQPYIYSDYSLFCAEVASTTNESLLIHHLIENEKDEKRKLYLINQELEQIRTTVFRQVMFAEFEKITHEKIENGTPLTAKDLCKIWRELNVKYFGPDMIVDEEIDMEWSRIPHFYWDFYVYQYATGYAAAHSFANSILKNGEKAVEAYKGFLKSGSSDYPINVLKRAGVDMTTPKPLEDTIKRFDELLDMLETV